MIVKFIKDARYNGQDYKVGDEAIVPHQDSYESLLRAGYILPDKESGIPAARAKGADAQPPAKPEKESEEG